MAFALTRRTFEQKRRSIARAYGMVELRLYRTSIDHKFQGYLEEMVLKLMDIQLIDIYIMKIKSYEIEYFESEIN